MALRRTDGRGQALSLAQERRTQVMLSRASRVPQPEPTLAFLVWVPPEADPGPGLEGKQFLWEAGSERWVGGGEKGQ